MINLTLIEETQNLGLKFKFSCNESNTIIEQAKNNMEDVKSLWQFFFKEKSDELILDNYDDDFITNKFIPLHQEFFNAEIKPTLILVDSCLENYRFIN